MACATNNLGINEHPILTFRTLQEGIFYYTSYYNSMSKTNILYIYKAHSPKAHININFTQLNKINC